MALGLTELLFVLVLIVSAIGIILIIVAEHFFMISHTDDEGNMPMGMETTNNKNN